MTTVVLVIHLLLALALVGVILLQRSEGGALSGLGGGGGGGGGLGGLMSSRGSANLLTRATTFLAIGFLTTSLLLAILAARESGPRSILDDAEPVSAPAEQAPVEAPAEPEVPAVPTAPVAE